MPVPTPGSAVFVQSRDIVSPPTDGAGNTADMHARVVPTNAGSKTLEEWLIDGGFVGGVPFRTTNPPCAITLEVESGATGKVWACLGGTASATRGKQVPVAPAVLRIPWREGIRNDLISLIGDQGGGTAVQVFFEWLAE